VPVNFCNAYAHTDQYTEIQILPTTILDITTVPNTHLHTRPIAQVFATLQKRICYFDNCISHQNVTFDMFYITEYATRAGSLLRRQISAMGSKTSITICSKRVLFPYNDSCHVNYSSQELSVPL